MKRRAAEIAHELDDHFRPDEVEGLLNRLAAYQAPEPSPGETERLLAHLRPLVPRHQPRRFREVGMTAQPVSVFVEYLLSQRMHFRPVWWLLSLLIVALGFVVEPILADGGIPLSALAPVLAIGSVAYGFRSLKGAALEIELSCPVTPAQIFLSRLLVIMSYYLVLGAGLAAVAGGSSVRLLFGWSAALVLFTGLMLILTVHLGMAMGTILTLLLWVGQLMVRTHQFSLFAWPGGAGWLTTQMIALAAGLGLLVITFAGTGPRRLLDRRS